MCLSHISYTIWSYLCTHKLTEQTLNNAIVKSVFAQGRLRHSTYLYGNNDFKQSLANTYVLHQVFIEFLPEFFKQTTKHTRKKTNE